MEFDDIKRLFDDVLTKLEHTEFNKDRPKKRGPYMPSNKKRSELIQVCVSSETKTRLMTKARDNGKTVSTYVLQLILKDQN